MQRNETCPHQSHGHTHCGHQVQHPAEQSSDTPLDYALVLGDAIDQSRFQDGEAIVLCPGCGEVADQLFTGLSEHPVRTDVQCFDCDIQLHRWSAVVTPNISTAPPTTDDLRALVQEYWERQFRVGVQDLGLPHTREFTEEVQRLAEVWDWKWTVTCQLCDRSLNQLNLAYLGYHHWQYEPDVGTSLCQFCHDFLHGGDESDQASRQDWRAKKLGLRDFRDLAVIRLALRDREVHDFDIPEDDPAYARRLRTRYNVPLSVDRIVTLVSEVRHDNTVQEVIRDHGSSPTVPDHNIHPV